MNNKHLQFNTNGSVIVPVIIVVLLILGVVGYFFFTNMVSKNAQSTDTTSSLAPTAPVTDFAPNLPANQKSTVVIRTSDSSTVTYLVAKDQVETFIKKLPAGDAVVSKSP